MFATNKRDFDDFAERMAALAELPHVDPALTRRDPDEAELGQGAEAPETTRAAVMPMAAPAAPRAGMRAALAAALRMMGARPA